MRYAYPYELLPQPEGGFTVIFPDVPEAITQGETAEEAASMAEDALVTALSFYTDNFEPLPQTSPAQGRAIAPIPALAAAKLALHEAMIEAGVSDVALAERLGIGEEAVRRLRDPLRQSRIAEIDAALRVLGKRLGIVVEAV
jgi:antitoxin HicB